MAVLFTDMIHTDHTIHNIDVVDGFVELKDGVEATFMVDILAPQDSLRETSTISVIIWEDGELELRVVRYSINDETREMMDKVERFHRRMALAAVVSTYNPDAPVFDDG